MLNARTATVAVSQVCHAVHITVTVFGGGLFERENCAFLVVKGLGEREEFELTETVTRQN